jgi:hypothetical protein
MSSSSPPSPPQPPSREATLKAMSAEPRFVNMCRAVEALRYNTGLREFFKNAVGTFDLAGLDLSARVTAAETPFEARLREAVYKTGAPTGAFFTKIVDARDADADVEALIKIYDAFEVTAQQELKVGGVAVDAPTDLERAYIMIGAFKYCVFGEKNQVTRALIQRVMTYLFMTYVAAHMTFMLAGAEVQAPEGAAPEPTMSPLSDLLELCKSTTNNVNNPVLNRVRETDVPALAQESGTLAATVRRQQMSLNRALTSIAAARRQHGDEVKQLGGFVALLVVCVGVFYGWKWFRPALFEKMKVALAITASATAMIVLAVTSIAILRPVERFEQFYDGSDGSEGFCTAAGQCSQAMSDWATEAAKQATLSTLDSTAALGKKELETRNESLAADLAAVSARVSETDIHYRSTLFEFNRVRQSRRFVVMSLAIALCLMVATIMGMPANVSIGLHIAAGVIILVVATLVYKGNAQRSRARWTQIYWPGPDDI